MLVSGVRLSLDGRNPTKSEKRREVLVRGVVQGVGFRPFVYRLALEEGLAGFVGNDTDGVTIEVEGPKERWRPFSPACALKRRPLARIDSVAVRELRRCRRDRLSDCCQRGSGPSKHRNSSRCGHLSGLPAGAAGPPGPPLPLSIFELHQLRAALHHHATDSLRPAADLDGQVSHVPGVPAGVRRSAEPALPCAAQCLLGVRAAGLAAMQADGSESAWDDDRLARSRRINLLIGGQNRGHQRHRRLSSERGCNQSGGGDAAARAQTPLRKAAGGDGARSGGGAGSLCADGRRRGAAFDARAADCAGARGARAAALPRPLRREFHGWASFCPTRRCNICSLPTLACGRW